MPVITDITIQEKNKDRCNIFIDGSFRLGLSLELVITNKLKKGMEITDEFFNEVVLEGEKKDCLAKAINYVSKIEKTKWQVKDYLTKKGYTDEASWYAIDKLKEYGYIDDVAYSKKFIELNSKNQGKNLIYFKLIQRGIKREDIDEAYNSLDLDNSENIKNLANKYLKNKERTKENLTKTVKYLVGRGFSFEEAKASVNFSEED